VPFAMAQGQLCWTFSPISRLCPLCSYHHGNDH
jgi:rubredoxin